jgi:hypothetical protein
MERRMKKLILSLFFAPLIFVGCASNDAPTSTPAAQGGTFYKNPHMENVWLADGFNFSGYDTVYVADTQSTAHFQADEAEPHEIAKKGLQRKTADALDARKVFAKVVTREADIPAGAKVLKLENTIIEYSKGGGGARYFVGLYGGGQPVLKVRGKMNDGAKPVFSYEARRSGVSAGARLAGAFKTDVDIQAEDIDSMVKDLTDFIEQTAKGQAQKQ